MFFQTGVFLRAFSWAAHVNADFGNAIGLPFFKYAYFQMAAVFPEKGKQQFRNSQTVGGFKPVLFRVSNISLRRY